MHAEMGAVTAVGVSIFSQSGKELSVEYLYLLNGSAVGCEP